ncbi:disulfide bond formation protein B [Alphaproteobacteria bacterium]|nr:disulfide bond formation protein B [Alphaproteobacteria bacterium]
MSSQHKAVFFVLGASATALLSAAIFQFGFGYKPCVLCQLQQGIFAVSLCLSLTFLYTGLPSRWIMLSLIATLLSGAGVAFYQVLVEQGIVPLPSFCKPAVRITSAHDLLAQLTPLSPSCAKPAWSFIGLSMAAWNMLYSCALLNILLFSLRPSPQIKRNRAPDA